MDYGGYFIQFSNLCQVLGVDFQTLQKIPPHFSAIIEYNMGATLRMTARIQGFPNTWTFFDRKTANYRQIGNAFPPPVAAAVASQIIVALSTQHIFKVA
jgi:DNA (cytosine-5)-methyltransferase 1